MVYDNLKNDSKTIERQEWYDLILTEDKSHQITTNNILEYDKNIYAKLFADEDLLDLLDESYEDFKFLLNQENLDPMLYERLCKYFCEVIGV